MTQITLENDLLRELKNYLELHPHYCKIDLRTDTARVKEVVKGFIQEDHIRKIFREELEKALIEIVKREEEGKVDG